MAAASIAVVVDLPCEPDTAITRLPRVIAASSSARVSTGSPAERAAAISG